MQFYANNCMKLVYLMIGLRCPIIALFQLQYQSVWEFEARQIYLSFSFDYCFCFARLLLLLDLYVKIIKLLLQHMFVFLQISYAIAIA